MRVLWLSHLIPYPPKGGVLQRAYHLLKEVAKHHDVDLLAFHQPNLMRPLVSSLDEGIKEAQQVLNGFCRKVEFVEISSQQGRFSNYFLALKSLLTQDPYNINWLKSPDYMKVLCELLQSSDYDLVHFDTISLVPYFNLVGKIPTVLDHHNIESHMLIRRAENESNVLKKWYFRQEGLRLEIFEKQFCPQFSLNITCSEIDKQRLQGIAPASWVEEVPNGVDVNYFKPDSSVEQEKSLIFIGTLNWYPNIEAVRFLAHELWPSLKAEVPGISIDIIGAEPPADIVRLSETDNDFRVHGFVDDILPFMNKAAIYVCPIMDGGGTKLKVLDALSMEKALVAHEIACEGISVQNEKNVIFAQSVDEYVNAIKLLIENEPFRRTMGAEARKLVEEKYAYEMVGKNLSNLYEQCSGSTIHSVTTEGK